MRAQEGAPLPPKSTAIASAETPHEIPPLLAFAGLLLIAACSADYRNPSEPHTSVPRPSFSLGSGGIENTSCSQDVAWVSDPGLTLFSVDFGTDPCGNLVFEGQARDLYVSWIPDSQVFFDWVNSWQVKERRLQGPDEMDVVFRDSVPGGRRVDLPFSLALRPNADAVSPRLFINNADGTVATTSYEFDQTTDEAAVQFWRHIDAPVLDSAIAWSQSAVRLYWRNKNPQRSYDETEIYRDGYRVDHTEGTVQTFTDSPVPPGYHYYQIRHLAPGSPFALGRPNSDYSAEDTVVMPPQDYTTMVCCDLIIFVDSTYTWLRQIWGGTSPYQDQWWYSDSTASHNWSDPVAVGTNAATYSSEVGPAGEDFAFVLVDSTDDADGRRVGAASYNWVIGAFSRLMQLSGLPEDQRGRLVGGRCVPLPARGRARHEWMERVVRSGRGPELCALVQP